MRVVVFLKRSFFRKYVEQERDVRIADLMSKGDPTVRRMIPGHQDHEETVDEVRAAVESLGIDALFHENPRRPIEGDIDLVITVGGDGTLLAASHQVGPRVPILGVNSAPDHSVGFFCGASKGSVRETLESAKRGTLEQATLTRMQVAIANNVVHKRVLNEALYCHESPAATSRYILQVTNEKGELQEEEQKSSGLWIGPAAGSTAAQRSAGGDILPLGSSDLQYVVREPYVPLGARMLLTKGRVHSHGRICLLSKMRRAKVFLDGDQTIYDVGIGDSVVLSASDEPLIVCGLGSKPRSSNA